MPFANVVARTRRQLAPVTARFRNPQSGRAADRSAQAPSDLQSSMNLPVLFSALGSQDRVTAGLRVLNLGAEHPDTTRHLARYGCQLHNADLLGQLGHGHINARTLSPNAAEELGQQMQSLLLPSGTHRPGLPADQYFDVCLLWDIPHYLDSSALRLLGHGLGTVLKHDSISHGFCAHTHQVDLPARRYGIAQSTQIRATVLPGNRAPQQAHTPADLKLLLPQLQIKRGTLLRDGRIEVLMTVPTLD